ncbi:GumC family protein [Jannaschia rubra]|uniref:non-specific protein-tyrosine kinase n=1 Tax=Jannaschia rubra TaxID=282197 RepID=A0A0M6XRQ5_9RHOB|nr:AAA family ATPase [Jannaschia rubra]CTQ32714.1 Tyrosine-protein kinase ptk [Jannaschia rubra]SFF88081.1 capsular exopolysaccharide family [Jannaschia rubra]
MIQPAGGETGPETRSQDVVLDFGRILAIIRRSWWLIGGLGLAGAIVAAIAVLQVTPTYQSGAELLLGQKARLDDAMGALFQDLRLDDAAISGEVAIITSGRLLSEATERLDLQSHPEFNPDLRPPEDEPGLLSRIADGAVNLLKRAMGLGTGDEPDGLTGPGGSPVRDAAMTGKTALGEQADYVDQLRQGLSVRQVGRSNLVSIHYLSTDRMLAAAVPNALIDIYLEDQIDRRFAVLSRATSGLESRLNTMRDRVESSERATIDYRTRNLSDGFGSRVQLDQQLSDLSVRLSAASAEYAELASELRGLNTLIDDQGAIATAGLFASPTIDTLRVELSDLRRREDRLREQFGSDIPQLADTVREIERLEAALSEEVLTLRDDKAKLVDIAGARRQALANELSELEQRAIALADREVRLAQLEREQSAAQLVYETFLDRFNQTRDVGDLQESDAQVIDYASPPPAPVAPNKKLAVALGGFAGAFLGLALAFGHAVVDTRLRTLDGVQRLMRGADTILMPRVSSFWRRGDPLHTALRNPQSAVAESLRTLRSSLMMAAPASGGFVVTFVSTRPGAGKTTTAVNLGRLFAKMGKSCVLVDADQRRGNIAALLKLPLDPDLIDVIEGEATLDEALHEDSQTGMHILTTRLDAPDPAGILLSRKMTDLIGTLKQRFDVVIVDTAPLLPVADALPVVRLADQVVMMVPYGSKADDVATGRRMLDRAGRPPSCAVMSFAPANTISSYY